MERGWRRIHELEEELRNLRNAGGYEEIATKLHGGCHGHARAAKKEQNGKTADARRRSEEKETDRLSEKESPGQWNRSVRSETVIIRFRRRSWT